ncbi:hypothetical protein CPB84DRAFT_1793918 [Gymnopilus junonius]|uniref:Uncharacterized protein n=1 Tax=Gymnopilus junonius TaxID=109634 RepID=A0A9P5NC24_GYMJU|nr:hypothetical protein CPB84DRAFT_1793918 [Gymnopilus junonius]
MPMPGAIQRWRKKCKKQRKETTTGEKRRMPEMIPRKKTMISTKGDRNYCRCDTRAIQKGRKWKVKQRREATIAEEDNMIAMKPREKTRNMAVVQSCCRWGVRQGSRRVVAWMHVQSLVVFLFLPDGGSFPGSEVPFPWSCSMQRRMEKRERKWKNKAATKIGYIARLLPSKTNSRWWQGLYVVPAQTSTESTVRGLAPPQTAIVGKAGLRSPEELNNNA